jgi:hypothetical protein
MAWERVPLTTQCMPATVPVTTPTTHMVDMEGGVIGVVDHMAIAVIRPVTGFQTMIPNTTRNTASVGTCIPGGCILAANDYPPSLRLLAIQYLFRRFVVFNSIFPPAFLDCQEDYIPPLIAPNHIQDQPLFRLLYCLYSILQHSIFFCDILQSVWVFFIRTSNPQS